MLKDLCGGEGRTKELVDFGAEVLGEARVLNYGKMEKKKEL